MDKIKFNVSAKTARLIGRENISDSNGAMIELVKNAYDADAANVYIQFNILFENLPSTFSYLETKKYFSEEEFSFISKYYEQEGDVCTRKAISSEVEETLKNLFFSKNQILILDDGCGMDEKVVRSVWMNIGTNDKEVNYLSKKKRVKTGAKGIGRFALEKLSQRTEIYSKKSSQTVYWGLDWLQFDKSELLDEIKADIDIKEESFKKIVKNVLKENFKHVSHFAFESGTLVILKGTREIWNDRIFNRINNNLKSINPFGNVDKFLIQIENINKPAFNFKTNDQFMSKEDYDYHIIADFDGINIVQLCLERNEIDLHATKQKMQISEKDYEFDLSEFWNRKAFENSPYLREEYNKTIKNKYKVTDLINNTSLDEFKKIGKFSLDLYFLKSGNSEYSLIKEIKVNKRKKLLKNFSGIKLYRDNFKVRPYGDEGPMFDWLELGKRAQSSPAGVSHPTGSWRVVPYQIIGNITISRLNNANLVDMANRESLALNDTYFLFVELIQKIISKFEYDRQYIYREYGAWLDQKEDEINKSASIIQNVIDEKEKRIESNNNSNKSYSEKEYKEAIYESHKERKRSIDTQRILMNFSSAGMITSTFAHEMKEVADKLVYSNEQMRYCCDYLLDHKKYSGLECFNPYLIIEQSQNTQELLSKWISLNMNGVGQNSFEKKNIDMNKFINKIKEEWQVLMKYKHIEIIIEEEKNCVIEIALIDLYLIFNNLFLNSSHFLEQKVDNEQRLIKISFKKTEENIFITYENNGPSLSEKYAKSPDMIFEAGETSKEEGTGLGLWICKEAVNRNQGEIHVLPKESGFHLEIKFNKGD